MIKEIETLGVKKQILELKKYKYANLKRQWEENIANRQSQAEE